MTYPFLLLIFVLSSPARAELHPQLKQIPECQSQAEIPLVFNSDRYLANWHREAGLFAKLVTKLRTRCESVRKKFPGEEGRIASLRTEQKDLIRDAKKNTIKQQEISKYISDLRRDMEKFGGPEAKGCVASLKKAEEALPAFSKALEKDANESCL